MQSGIKGIIIIFVRTFILFSPTIKYSMSINLSGLSFLCAVMIVSGSQACNFSRITNKIQ